MQKNGLITLKEASLTQNWFFYDKILQDYVKTDPSTRKNPPECERKKW